MSQNSPSARPFPRIGMRNIKTATAAALCALVYFFLDRSPAFACIGAIFGMGSDLENSRLHGGNRLFGTLIGGLLGMALFRIYLIFYPHGGRPDGDDWHSTGPAFQYLQSQGFRIFASVGINSFSYIKDDISAVICDRLHPDGTTLRNGKALEWYSQFYDAREIIDLDVRPNLGVTW